jgi:hypothetical protein
MGRFAITFLISMVMAVPLAVAKKPYTLPSYIVMVKLSPKAEERLTSEQVKVHINAHYFGLPVDEKDGDKNGEVALGDEDADITGSSAAAFGKASFNARDLARVVDGSVRVHVTASAGKKLLSGSEITCTEFKDMLPTTARPHIPISCKMVNE